MKTTTIEIELTPDEIQAIINILTPKKVMAAVKAKSEPWKPEMKEQYWFWDLSYEEPIFAEWEGRDYDHHRLAIGNVHRTFDAAEVWGRPQSRRMTAEFNVKLVTARLNAARGWAVKWDDKQANGYIIYSHRPKRLIPSKAVTCRYYLDWMYVHFDDAQTLIDECEADLMVIITGGEK